MDKLIMTMFGWIAVAFCGQNAVAEAASKIVFEDGFDSLDNWALVTGSRPRLVTSDDEAEHAPYLALANGVIRAQLKKPLAGHFAVRVRMLHTVPERGLWIALLNDDGTKGYGFRWDSTPPEAHQGQGFVGIVKFNLEAEPAWGDGGERISSIAGSGRDAVQRPFAELEWSRNNATGAMELKVDGMVKVAADDTEFSEFSKIYIRGNTVGFFDDLEVISYGEEGSDQSKGEPSPFE